MLRLMLVGSESAERLAQRLTAAAVRLAIGTERAQTAIAHSAEGLVTPLVRDEAPVDTGALRDSLRAHVHREGTELVVAVESDRDYAETVLHGAGIHHVPDPHEEWDTYGLQVFTVGAQTVFALHTHHRGQHPDDFVGRAMDRAEAPLRAVLVLAGEQLAVAFRAEFASPLP